MSEFQDYRWSCVDRLLAPADAKKVAQLSSHITATASSAQVDYSYGDFKHDPIFVLEKYFDVFTYEANWGSQTVAFRFDIGSVDQEALALFSHSDVLTITRTERSIIVAARFWDDDFMGNSYIFNDYESSEDERFHQIYSDTLHSDFRGLFLLWLKASAQHGPELADPSAPIPAGLSELGPDYDELIEFINLDLDLVTATTRFSSNTQRAQHSKPDFGSLLDKLPPDRIKKILSGILTENPGPIIRSLKAELLQLIPKKPQSSNPSIVVRFSEILALATEIRKDRERKTEEDAQRAHETYLETISQHEDKIWRLVEVLISEKKPKTYDQAVECLNHLRNLYTHHSKTERFVEKVRKITNTFPTLSGLHRRVKDAGHFSTEIKPTFTQTNLLLRRLPPITTRRQQFIDDLLTEIAERSL